MSRQSELVKARAQGWCEVRYSEKCRGWGQQVHHRKRRSQGGGNELSNLLLVCDPCHDKIHHEPTESYERGFMVKSTGSPEDIGVVAG